MYGEWYPRFIRLSWCCCGLQGYLEFDYRLSLQAFCLPTCCVAVINIKWIGATTREIKAFSAQIGTLKAVAVIHSAHPSLLQYVIWLNSICLKEPVSYDHGCYNCVLKAHFRSLYLQSMSHERDDCGGIRGMVSVKLDERWGWKSIPRRKKMETARRICEWLYGYRDDVRRHMYTQSAESATITLTINSFFSSPAFLCVHMELMTCGVLQDSLSIPATNQP